MYPILLALLFVPRPGSTTLISYHHELPVRESVSPYDVTPEVRTALRKFSTQALQSFKVWTTVPYQKSIYTDPLNLATFWTVINERMFDVETIDLVEALGLPEGRISSAYSLINNYLNQDPRFLSTNAVFSDMVNATATSGFERLRTYFQTVDFRHQGDQVVKDISAYIRGHTKGQLSDQILPTDSPFYNSTRGVIVNTAAFTYNFEQAFIPSEQLKFRVTPEESQTVESIEVVGNFKVSQDENVTIVKIPFEGDRNKSLILIHPKNLAIFLENEIPSLVKKVDTISNHISSKLPVFQYVSARLRLPTFNFTTSRAFTEIDSLLKVIRTTTAVCFTDTKRASFLQNPVQVSRVSLDTKAFTAASVIGVQVDNVQEYRKEFGGSESGSSTSGISITDIPQEIKSDSQQPQTQYSQLRSGMEEQQIYVHVQEDTLPSQRSLGGADTVTKVSVGASYRDIVVDSPFLVAVHDYEIGMHSFTVISGPQRAVPDKQESFSEYSKLSRWACLAPPAPLGESL